MPRILIVVQDRGALRALALTATAARDFGWDVRIITTGASRGQFITQFDLDEEPLTDPVTALGSLRPDVVVVGCSSPIDTEQTFALAARAVNIPVVLFSDIEKAFLRMRKLDKALVLCGDEVDAQNARKDGYRASVVGLREALAPQKSEAVSYAVESYRKGGRKIVLLAASGQPARIEQEIACVLDCAAMTSTPHAIIFQPNPKIINQAHPSGGTWGARLRDLVNGRALWMEGPVVLYADATISPSSSALTAACARKIGIGLRPTTVESIMAKESGVLEQLAKYENEYGLPIIRHPVDLAPLLATRLCVNVTAFNVRLAFNAIAQFSVE